MSETIHQNPQSQESSPSDKEQTTTAVLEIERQVAEELRRMSEEEGPEGRRDRMLRAGRGEVIEIYAVGLPHDYPPLDID